MSETKELHHAQELISSNQKDKAIEILWKLYESKSPIIKLGTILSLITVIDSISIRDSSKLVEIIEEGINIAITIGSEKERLYLLIKKSHTLMTQSSFLASRQKNLKLAANVFDWIDFSLKKDKEEYEFIFERRSQLMKEIENVETEVLSAVESSLDHRFKGHIYMGLGDFYAVKYFNDRMDLMQGGSRRSMLANTYFVRRWNLDKFIVFDTQSRRQINEAEQKCYYFFEIAITEFETGGYTSELSYALYNLAVNLKSIGNAFHKAGRSLRRAKELAKVTKDERLLMQVGELEVALKDKNKHVRNYVEELGLE